MRYDFYYCYAPPSRASNLGAKPRLVKFGCIYRHYLVTHHAMDRYAERVGGSVSSLLESLSNAWLFDINRKGAPRRACAAVAINERAGGYALSDGKAIFIIKPGDRWHTIVTTILVNFNSHH